MSSPSPFPRTVRAPSGPAHQRGDVRPHHRGSVDGADSQRSDHAVEPFHAVADRRPRPAGLRVPPPKRRGVLTAGKGRGRLYKLTLAGRLLRHWDLGEDTVYHASVLTFDGTDLWVPLAEYRPHSQPITYRVNPESGALTREFPYPDHLGGVFYAPAAGGTAAAGGGTGAPSGSAATSGGGPPSATPPGTAAVPGGADGRGITDRTAARAVSVGGGTTVPPRPGVLTRSPPSANPRPVYAPGARRTTARQTAERPGSSTRTTGRPSRQSMPSRAVNGSLIRTSYRRRSPRLVTS